MRKPTITLIFGYCFISSLVSSAQSCGLGTSHIPCPIDYKSTYLKIELSGYFPYIYVPPAEGVPYVVKKYKTESLSGTYHYISPGNSNFGNYTGSYSGASTFSSTNWSIASNTKYHVRTSTVGSSGPITNSYNLNHEEGILSIWLNYSITPEVFRIDKAQMTSVEIQQQLYYSGASFFAQANLKQELGDEFTRPEAHARALANVGPVDISTRKAQYWNNDTVYYQYHSHSPNKITVAEMVSPYNAALYFGPATWRRVVPVECHAEQVEFRIKLEPQPCGGEYKLSLEFVEWPIGQTEPSIPNLPSLHIEEPIIPDQERVTYWPSETTYRSYEECGLPLKQGYNQKLVSAKLTSLGSCSHLGAGHGGGGLGGR
jgi:hypothetical protein